jgi:hypothetical protein
MAVFCPPFALPIPFSLKFSLVLQILPGLFPYLAARRASFGRVVFFISIELLLPFRKFKFFWTIDALYHHTIITHGKLIPPPARPALPESLPWLAGAKQTMFARYVYAGLPFLSRTTGVSGDDTALLAFSML